MYSEPVSIANCDTELDAPRIFIVEDSPLISLDLQCTVSELGCEVVGPSRSLDEALLLMDEKRSFDAAIIDFVLEDGTCETLIHALRARSIPVIVYTGLTKGEVEALFPDVTVITKPHSPDDLQNVLRRLVSRKSQV
ncbi:MAG TPA: response regulator [Hyphomicrobium sp.]|nr:response regulator [Hyphomicrobium sp.]